MVSKLLYELLEFDVFMFLKEKTWTELTKNWTSSTPASKPNTTKALPRGSPALVESLSWSVDQFSLKRRNNSHPHLLTENLRHKLPTKPASHWATATKIFHHHVVCVQPTVDKTKTIKIHPKYLSNDLVERKEKGKKTNKIYSFIKNNQKLLNISFIRICENDVQGNDANLYIV